MFLFVLQFRITQKLGIAANMPILKYDELKTKLENNTFSVVLFGNETVDFDYTNYAIQIYQSQVKFYRSDPETAKQFKIDFTPVAILFFHSTMYDVFDKTRTALHFASWVNEIVYGRERVVTSPEDLRVVLEKPGNSVFIVDNKQGNYKVPETQLHYEVPSIFFSKLGIKVEPGIYVWRSADRQLIKANKNYQAALHTNLVDLNDANFSEKQYIAIYFTNTTNDEMVQAEINILNEMAQKVPNCMFAIGNGPVSDAIQNDYNIMDVKKPFFGIFETDEESEKKWLKTENVHDSKQILELLQNVCGDQHSEL